MAEVDEVTQTDRRWIIAGVDRRGRDMEIVIDGRTGDVLRETRRRPYR